MDVSPKRVIDDFGRTVPTVPASARSRSRSVSSSRDRSMSPAEGGRHQRNRRRMRSRSRSPPARHPLSRHDDNFRRRIGRRSISPQRRFAGHAGYSRRNGRLHSPARRAIVPRLSLDGPLMGFKQFLEHQRLSSLSSRANSEYDAYKEEFVLRQDQKFFHQFKDEEWLQERYEPSVVLSRVHRTRATATERQASFSLEQPIFDIDIDGVNEIPDPWKGSKFYENALFIRSIPALFKRAELIAVFSQSTGFVKLLLSEPNRNRNFGRFGLAIFDSEASCETALEALNGKQMNSWFQLALAPNLEPTRGSRIAPSICLTPSRIAIDLEQSMALMAKLDAESGLSQPEWISKSSEVATLRRLNMVLAYLRQVHFTCYYCALTAVDEEELRAKCTFVHRRQRLPEQPVVDMDTSDATDQPPAVISVPLQTGTASATALLAQEQWTKDLDSKITARLLSAGPPTQASQVQDLALAPFFEKQILKEADNKFRCGLCSKLFRGSEFVMKHLKVKHPDDCQGELEKSLKTVYFDKYRADADRPSMPPPPAPAATNGARFPAAHGPVTHAPPIFFNPTSGQGMGPYPSRYGPPPHMTGINRFFPGSGSMMPDNMRVMVQGGMRQVRPASPPDHFKRRRIVSYNDLDAPKGFAYSTPVVEGEAEPSLNYGLGAPPATTSTSDMQVADA